ncbi:16S rRNA (cytosine(1402)-N(4))-methyltransferase RsmH [Marinococcus halophilus]|uniref:16S rRNA (cytosine(1402)-N(4))-methyltransferase RsmH n=1 Tax=Marinococcus halophilus TaxID=1371 RepID=UPI0009A8EAB7|nr:16S rRNA (cytosine(1402)-N(4))-methyltransferase RsmH [Marinococcus halophilus]
MPPQFEHETVLKEASVRGLNIRPDGVYVDCTLGGGGHSEEVMKQLSSEGLLIAFDQDEEAIAHAEQRLRVYGENFRIVHSNFQFLKEELLELHTEQVNGILFDLGVSSPQFDRPERGFSYRYNAPLDMRMDRHRQERTAAHIVNEASFQEIWQILSEYGEERFSKQIARKIEKAREEHRIETTEELVEIIKSAIPAPARRKGGHPAKRTFQALRIAVNNELDVFKEALDDALTMLAPGGRLCVITFHSLEDRICKKLFKQKSSPPPLPKGLPVVPDEAEPDFNLVTKKPILPSEDELTQNPRAASAKLRIIEKREEDKK